MRDVDKLFTIYYYLGDVKDNRNRFVFSFNPTSFDIEPQQRVEYQQTMGGVLVIPFISNYVSGYDRVFLNMSGVWNVYSYKKESKKSSDVDKKTIAERVLNKFGLNISGDRYWLSVKQKEKERKILDDIEKRREGDKDKNKDLLRLFLLVNNSFIGVKDGSKVLANWSLEFSTPVFKGDKKVYIRVYPVSPMVIRERADRPFLPEWSVRFGVFNDDIVSLYREINNLCISKSQISGVV